MNKIIENYIFGIIFNKDKSINQISDELYYFFQKINSLPKPHELLSLSDINLERKYIPELIINAYKFDKGDRIDIFDRIILDIVEIIKYNEDMKTFTYYLN